jgi:hypothetical protein
MVRRNTIGDLDVPDQFSARLVEGEGDELDNAIQKLRFHVSSFGFPDFGGLRSSKKKDVRQRIKCMAAMLKQRQKDIEYRQQYEGKLTRIEQDREIFEDKYK